MDQARRCLRVDDYSGSTDGLPTDSWVLTLVAPGYGSQTLTRILDIPAGRTLTVVSRGTLFRGSVDDPAGFAAVATDWPIRSARTYPQAGLAVLATGCSATCVDANGVRWRSRRPACDGVIVPSALETDFSTSRWRTAPLGTSFSRSTTAASSTPIDHCPEPFSPEVMARGRGVSSRRGR